MKLFFRIFIPLFGFCLFSSLGISRGNPIMVIECFDFGEAIVGPEVAQLLTYFECDEGGGCPTGYIARVEDIDGEITCECIPDCSFITEECNICMEDIDWFETSDNNGDSPVGYCGCEGEGQVFCGCPPWLTFVAADGSPNFDDYCDIVEIECYDGDINAVIDDGCDNFNPDGSVTVTITIQLLTPPMMDGIPQGLTIQDLINCNLTNGENFVNALDEEYGGDTRVAFVDDDGDGFIEIEFTRDPDDESIIEFLDDEITDIVVEPCELAPIPTLSSWMIITLSLILLISGLIFIRRKEVVRVLGTF